MASAVLASRNETCWGEPKVYMRKYTNNSINNPHLSSRFNPNPSPNTNPYLNPNPNPSRQIHGSSSKPHVWQSHEPSPKSVPPLVSVSSSTLNRRKESSHGGYVTFHVAAYTTKELKELRKRLFSEFEQVRTLIKRIDELQSRSHIPGSFGVDREVLSRPPTPQLDHAEIVSPGGKKKKKNISGKKRPLPFSSFCREPKRSAVSDSSRIGKLVTSMMGRCGQILTKLMKQKYSWVFNKPVDTVALKLPDYHQVIRDPMDLGTVKSRLNKNEYDSPLDFASDVRLTFNNALTYNPKGQDVHAMAENLLSRFNEMFNPAYRKFEAEYQYAVVAEQANQKVWVPPPNVLPQKRSLPDPVPVQVQEVSAAPLPMPAAPTAKPVKLPKPNAKELNKREMSFEEKAKLGVSLQNTPPERMDQLMQIIKRRNSHLAKDEDEIELDIETIDNETLWELDRFVSYNKKAMNKTTVRDGPSISNSISAAQINKSPVPAKETMPEAAVQKNKKGDPVEEDVDIGEEIPISNFPPVEIEKDVAANNASSRSSSSSSSSSGSDSSSSSGSDSGSSSGSDSDADSAQSPLVESREPAPTVS